MNPAKTWTATAVLWSSSEVRAGESVKGGRVLKREVGNGDGQ